MPIGSPDAQKQAGRWVAFAPDLARSNLLMDILSRGIEITQKLVITRARLDDHADGLTLVNANPKIELQEMFNSVLTEDFQPKRDDKCRDWKADTFYLSHWILLLTNKEK